MDSPQPDLATAIAALDQTVSRVTASFQTAPPSPPDAWGPREVLCHLIFWHEWTLRSVRATAVGGPPLRQPDTMAQIDQWNAAAIAARQDRSLADLVADLTDLQRQLAEAARSIPDPKTIVAIRMDGSELTAPARLQMMNQHLANHLAEWTNAR